MEHSKIPREVLLFLIKSENFTYNLHGTEIVDYTKLESFYLKHKDDFKIMIKMPKEEKISFYSRKGLHTRQQGLCFYCELETPLAHFTRDHIIPISKGGKAGPNLVGACRGCNNAKGDMSLAEFLNSDYLRNKLRIKIKFKQN